MKNYFKKSILSVFIVIIVFISLIIPSKAYALPDLDDFANIGDWAWNGVIKPALKQAGAVSWKNFLNMYLGKMAKESAEWLGSGGKGQKPTFLTNPGDYLEQVGDEALGEFIDQTAKSFTGKSLCDIGDPTIKFNILASFDPEYEKMQWNEESNCPFSKIRENAKKIKIKNLFDISLDIREGPVGQYKSNISNLLAGDTTLNKADAVILQSIFGKGDAPCVYDERGFFIGRNYCGVNGDNLTLWVNPGVKEMLDVNDDFIGVQENLEKIIKKIQEDSYSSIQASQDALDIVKTALSNMGHMPTNLISETDTSEGKVQFSGKPTYKCINMDMKSFCNDSVCHQFAEWSPPAGSDPDAVCKGKNNYKAAVIYAKRANKYVKQLVDWGNTLSDMIEKSMPTEEMANLPDLDPLEDLERMYTPEGSAVGAQVKLSSNLGREITDSVNNSKFYKGQIQGRMNDITTKISNIVKTPSTWVDETARTAVKEGSASVKQYTGVAAADAAQIFMSTLASKLLETAKKGLNPNPSPDVDRGSDYLSENMPKGTSDQTGVVKLEGPVGRSGTGSVTISKEESKAFFADLATPNLRRGNEFTIYDEFTVCPQEKNYTTTFNCIIDYGLRTAIEERATMKKAMDKGFINPGDTVGEPGDYTSQLSYPVIKKLRRARIFPLGLEIAAYKIFNGTVKPTNLGKIVKSFDQGVLLSNGDLEKYDNETTPPIPVGWNFNKEPDTHNDTYESVYNPYTDSYSYKIDISKVSAQTGVRYGIKSNKIYIQPETTYSVSARIKLDGLYGDDFGLRVHCNKDDGTEENFQYTWNDSGNIYITNIDSSSWQEVSGTFTTNSEADYCNIILAFGNGDTGQVNIDSVKMVKGNTIPENYTFQESPFYHLVNPNWLLKAPSYKCGTMAYSSIPLPETTQRQKACVDLKDCIQENDNGKCLSYSYCTKEKNTWDFNGQSCPSQFGSCDTYIRKNDGQTFSYLTNTLDFDGCDSTNAGCMWYCNDWSKDEGRWKCVSPGESWDYKSSEYNSDKKVESLDNTLFLTSNAKDCLSPAVDCNEYIDMSKGNLIYNGGFEIIKDKEVEGWGINLEVGKEVSEDSSQGEYAMTETGDWNYSSQDVFVISNSEHILSFVAKTDDNKELAINLKFYNEDEDVLTPQSDSEIDTPDFDGWSIDRSDYNCHLITKDLTKQYSPYSPYSFKFKAPEGAQKAKVSIGSGSDGSGSIFVDQVSLFNGLERKSYSSYASQNSKVYLQEPEECQLDDVGCEFFTNQETNIKIPAVINESDKCPGQCLGYNSFLEMPTSFDLESSREKFIPSTGVECSAPGCESFTNLGTVEKGGESREHYSYLRKCLILSEISSNCSNFYTWVGSDTAGYQLKRYQLEEDNNEPATIEEYEDAKIKWGECENETDLLDNPHCKQFYDSNGNKYFRIYENTISCSDNCIKYRRDKKDEADETEYYMGLPEKSQSCSEDNVGCKEYKGTDASSAQRIIFNDFEDGTISSWESGEDSILSISNEAITFPGHSLGVSPADMETDRRMIFYDVSELIDLNEGYDLNFWVKGVSSLTVGFSSLQEKTVTNINPEEWHEINLGPFMFNDGFSSDEKLRIESETDVFYIDNVLLKASSSIKLIEDSWQTPEACNIDVIGCSTYTDKDNNKHFLNSFSHLCKASEVGCSAFIDTKNYKSPYSKRFDTSKDTFIIVGKDEQVYRVDNKDSRCHSSDKGCQKLGKPTLDLDDIVGWKDVYFKNNPDQYETNSIICESKELGCQAYKDGYYFKDPEQFNKTCEYKYKEDVLVYGQSSVGWFKQGNQPCYTKDDGTDYKSNDVTYGILPADENVNGVDYKGFVGVCTRNQNNCTQFQTEHINDDGDIKTRSYYYIDDNQRLDKNSCDGQVSRADGCILFKNPNITNLNGEVANLYNSFATYKKYEDENNTSIVPFGCENVKDCSEEENSDYCKYCDSLTEKQRENNMNDIIKVTRDRVCGEWLSCISSHLVWDKSSNSYVEECDYIGRCDELIGKGDDSQCGNIVESSGDPLNEIRYKDRDVSWNGMDYSGLSIFNTYPIETLSPYVDENKEFLTYNNNNIGVNDQNKQPQLSCKVYPEKDSPYKEGAEDSYPNVNICSEEGGDGTYQDCQCGYTKTKFGQIITKYYNPNSDIPNGVCSRVGPGHQIEESCDPPSRVEQQSSDFESPCGRGGMCQSLTGKSSAIGQRGFCLEPDPSKPEDINACISWWPGRSLSDPVTNTQSISASYKPSANRLWYCSKYSIDSKELHDETSRQECRYDKSFSLSINDCQHEFAVDENANDCFKDYLDNKRTIGVYKIDPQYRWTKSSIDRIRINYKFNFKSDVESCKNNKLTHDCIPDDIEDPHKIDKASLTGSFELTNANSWRDKGECSWYEEEVAASQLNRDFKIAAIYPYIEDKVSVKANFTDSLLTGFTVTLDAGHTASSEGDVVDDSSGLTFKIYSAIIDFGQCGKVVKIPIDENGIATVFTNRINNIRDYSYSSFDGKDYGTKCQPWGALHYDSNWNPSTTNTILSSNDTCYKDQDKGTIWKDKNELKKIIPKINTCWGKDNNNYSEDKCDGSYKWNILSDLNIYYPDYKLPHIEDKDQSDYPFSINGKVEGTLESEKIYSAKMEFYAWVDKNAMPMRNLEIDWGGDQINDNSLIQSYNLISKNYKPVCCESKDECSNMDGAVRDLDPGLNFGNIPTSCNEDFLKFERTYFCEGSDSAGWEADLDGDGNKDCTDACCFKPKIMIKDNWGFSNDSDNTTFDGIIKVKVPEEE